MRDTLKILRKIKNEKGILWLEYDEVDEVYSIVQQRNDQNPYAIRISDRQQALAMQILLGEYLEVLEDRHVN
jgi:hypothetical protein